MKPRLRKKDRVKARQAAKPISRKAVKKERAEGRKSARIEAPVETDRLPHSEIPAAAASEISEADECGCQGVEHASHTPAGESDPITGETADQD
jgi:hypothetical protein